MEDLSKLAVKLLLLFVVAQLVGVYTGTVILRDISHNPYIQPLVVTAQPNDASNAGLFFLYMMLSAAVLLAIVKFIKSDIVFRLIEVLLVSTSSSIVFYALFRAILPYDTAIVAGTAAGIALAIVKFFYSPAKNIATIAATAGVGVIFGISFGVWPTIIFLILLSCYDYIAVFITKHMVDMADFMIKKDLAFTITAKQKMYAGRGIPPQERRIDLGSGDIVAPVMFEVSLLPYGAVASAFVFFGALIAFTIFLVLVFRKRRVLPALPPIVFGMIVSFALGKLLGMY
jgi:presenilin-like A22 family membrane protease